MAKIGRPRAEVTLTDSERTELKRLTKRAHVNRAVAFRARVVLAVAEDTTDKAVARRLDPRGDCSRRATPLFRAFLPPHSTLRD